MKTILVATDFSKAALNAANYAADMALTINADILLLHVFQIPVSYGEGSLVMNLGDMQRIAEKDITELKEKLIRGKSGKPIIATEVRVGTFAYELETVCEHIKPYAVIMGSQGKTAAEHLLFGSHAVHAMKHLMWPLITVPPEAKFSSVKKIGLAFDFDKAINTIIIDEIKMLVKDFNAELHILNIGKEGEYNPEIVFESGLLEGLLTPIKPNYHFITNENTDEAIMDFAEKNQVDLLIVLPKWHSLPNKLVHKSHTKQFVLHSHVPVMALHQ